MRALAWQAAAELGVPLADEARRALETDRGDGVARMGAAYFLLKQAEEAKARASGADRREGSD